MLICNCTLCYSNPNACKTCSAYLKEYGTVEPVLHPDWKKWIDEWNKSTQTITWYPYPNYDKDRYELVEKKDWKIKQLKADIERFKEDLEQNKKDNELVQEVKSKIIEAMGYAEKELNELEK